MEKQQGVPRRPVVKKVAWMASSFGTGVAFAVGHHYFYQQLDGTTPPDTSFSVWGFPDGISRQQLNISIGNTLAFFNKAFLAIAIASAHEQISWKTIKRYPTELVLIDALFSSRDDVPSALNMRMWRRMPIPTLLLLVFWLIPLAPLITPSTLTIQSVLINTTTSARAPRADFTSMNFASISENFTDPTATWPEFRMNYRGPQFSVQKAVQGSLMSGAILPISAPELNSTWNLDFFAPAVSCKTLDNSTELRSDIITEGSSAFDFSELQYVSWVPVNGSDLPSNSTSPRSATVGGSPLALYVMIPPPLWEPATIQVPEGSYSNSSTYYDALVAEHDKLERSYYQNSTYLLQCTLQNASYNAIFRYINGVQNVTLSTSGSFNSIPYLNGFTASAAEETVDASLNLSSVQTFAYQAVMDAFASMLVGSVEWGASYSDGQISTASTFMATTDTSMATTALLRAREMTNVTQLLTSESDLLGDIQWVGNSVNVNETGTQPMAELMEEMFRNATVSLMSMVALNPNYTSPFAPPNVTVETWMSQNLYQYAASTLWITYGIAIGLSALSVLFGSVVVLTERAAYSTCFSTLWRVAHNVHLPISLGLQDVAGQDPLPGHLSNMVVRFQSSSSVVKTAGKMEGDDSQSCFSDSGRLLHDGN